MQGLQEVGLVIRQAITYMKANHAEVEAIAAKTSELVRIVHGKLKYHSKGIWSAGLQAEHFVLY